MRVERQAPRLLLNASLSQQVIDFGDTLEVSLSASPLADTLTCLAPGVPLDATNLVLRAFALFRRKTGLSQHFWCNLEKRVPAGAGLGGGSGNAATALWAANELTGRPASEAQLLEWSGEIGSDISVFFSTGAAYCTGRGEVVRNESPPLPLVRACSLPHLPSSHPPPPRRARRCCC
jgi:4-diphosphocytidyl-2-C-methyl-D-erythritol kinase